MYFKIVLFNKHVQKLFLSNVQPRVWFSKGLKVGRDVKPSSGTVVVQNRKSLRNTDLRIATTIHHLMINANSTTTTVRLLYLNDNKQVASSMYCKMTVKRMKNKREKSARKTIWKKSLLNYISSLLLYYYCRALPHRAPCWFNNMQHFSF